MRVIENEEAARRLARAIASDLSLYNEDKILEGLQADNLYEVLEEDDHNTVKLNLHSFFILL